MFGMSDLQFTVLALVCVVFIFTAKDFLIEKNLKAAKKTTTTEELYIESDNKR
jgi:hypothetical protein